MRQVADRASKARRATAAALVLALTTLTACDSSGGYCSSRVRDAVAQLAAELPQPEGSTELDAPDGATCADSNATMVDSRSWVIADDASASLLEVQTAALEHKWVKADLPNMTSPESPTLHRYSQKIDDKPYWLTLTVEHSIGPVPGREGQQSYDSLTTSVSAGSGPYD